MSKPQSETKSPGIHFTWPRAVNNSDLSSYARHVAATLALEWMNAKGFCYVKHDTLAAKTGLSKKTLQRAIKELVTQGWIIYKPGKPGQASEFTAQFSKVVSQSTKVVPQTTMVVSQTTTGGPTDHPTTLTTTHYNDPQNESARNARQDLVQVQEDVYQGAGAPGISERPKAEGKPPVPTALEATVSGGTTSRLVQKFEEYALAAGYKPTNTELTSIGSWAKLAQGSGFTEDNLMVALEMFADDERGFVPGMNLAMAFNAWWKFKKGAVDNEIIRRQHEQEQQAKRSRLADGPMLNKAAFAEYRRRLLEAA